jgi:biopolymer transport protein ExbD
MMLPSRVLRLLLLPLAATQMSGLAPAKEDGADFDISKAKQYNRADTNLYYRPDILKANPGAVIIPKGDYNQQGDSYYFTPKIKAPKTLQFEVYNDWIEPITPPDAPPGLAIPPDQMQIREPQGDVEVALPNAPANFAPVNDGMVVPNGAVIKTGANATAAVLFGGVDSARLMPNSAAAIQQTLTAASRAVEVDLTSGGVFSKVGQQIGVKGEYEVHTPNGTAVAHGTDFVTIITGNRTDVWIEQGTVSLEAPDSKAAQMAVADGSGPLKHIQVPVIADAKTALSENSATLTAIFNFIPMANQKIASIRAKATRGEVLTSGQTDYLNRIKQVPSLIKLALVEKAPPPPLAATPAPIMREPAAEGSPIAAVPATPATPAAPPTPAITLGPNDQVGFTNTPGPVDDAALHKGLADLAAANPKQLVVIQETSKVSPAVVKKVVDAVHAVKLKAKILKYKAPATAASPVAPTPTPAASPATAATPAAPVIPPTPAVPLVHPSAAEGIGGTNAPAETEKPAPHMSTAKVAPAALPAKVGPMTVVIHVNGSIKFQGKTMTLAQFQASLMAVIKAKPDQELVIKSGTKVPYAHLKEVLDACANAQVAHITVSDPSPKPTPPPSASAPATNAPSDVTLISTSPAATTNLPTPGLLMHPSMQPQTPATPATNTTP